MARVYRVRCFFLILSAISISAQPVAGHPQQVLSRIPLGFEPNIGQANQATRYLARGSGFWLLLGSSDVSLAVQSKKEPFTLKVEWIGGNRKPVTQGRDLLPGTSNYFLGAEPKDWYTNIPNYGRIEYQDVYPGIDFIFYGNHRQLEYDMVLKPDARLDSVKLRFTGATRITVELEWLDGAGGREVCVEDCFRSRERGLLRQPSRPPLATALGATSLVNSLRRELIFRATAWFDGPRSASRAVPALSARPTGC